MEWNTENTVRLEEHAVSGPDDPALLAALDALETSGGTDLDAGLEAAYLIAERTFDASRINRVVLISDGGANVGVTSSDLIAARAGAANKEGIYLVGIGVGTASTYSDELMDTVTDLGRGASLFVGSRAEAERQLSGDGFMRVMDVAWRDVAVELDLPPGFSIERFSGEEYSTDHREIEPQNLAPDDAMVFYQTLTTCAPELANDDALLTVRVRYEDPITSERHTTATTARLGELLGGDTRLLDKGAAIYAYAEALESCAATSVSNWPARLEPAMRALERAEASNPGDADLAELREVIEAMGG